MVENELKEDKPQVVIFIAEWDEEFGPKVLNRFPNGRNMDLDEIADNVFLSFQTVFGNEPGVKFDRTNLVLPLKSHKRIAKTVLDSYKNDNVRGGYHPFIHVILLPLEFPEENMLIFNDIQNEIAEKYKYRREINLESFHSVILSIIEKLADHFHSHGEILRKEKKLDQAVNSHRKSFFLSKVVTNGRKEERFKRFLNNALGEYGKKNYKKGKRAYRQHKYSLSETFYKKASDLYEEAEDFFAVKKVRKKLKKTYKKWAKGLLSRGEVAKNREDLAEAYKSYSKAADLAKRTGKRRLIKKANKMLGKVPTPNRL